MYGTTELCDGIGIKPFLTPMKNVLGILWVSSVHLGKMTVPFLLNLGILQDSATFLGILHGYWPTVRNYASIFIRNSACCSRLGIVPPPPVVECGNGLPPLGHQCEGRPMGRIPIIVSSVASGVDRSEWEAPMSLSLWTPFRRLIVVSLRLLLQTKQP